MPTKVHAGPNLPPLLRSLQLTDSFFPVGAFAYSDGLETATSSGKVRDATTLGTWMDHLIESVFVDSEGRALAQTMAALEAGDTERLRQVDLELGALRPAREVRRASRAIGRRMLAIYGSIANDDFAPIARSLPEGNAATAYGAVFFHARVTMTDALLGFGYGRLAGTVSAAIRLMPLGHEEGQKLLTGRLGQLPEAAARIVANVDEPLRSFGPGLDVEQMNHQYVYSRLFRS